MVFVYFFLFLALLIFAIFYIVQFYNILFRNCAPYLNTHSKTIEKILAEIDIEGNETIYELGCGNAGFLQLLGKKYPNTRLFGYEYSFLPWLIANIQLKIHGVKNLKIVRKNIFKLDLAKANIIYCYLNIGTMQKLKKKFNKECQGNTQIISNKFQIHDWTPRKVIEVKEEKVYFYKNDLPKADQ